MFLISQVVDGSYSLLKDSVDLAKCHTNTVVLSVKAMKQKQQRKSYAMDPESRELQAGISVS
jgi:hypothetical protein